MTESEEKASIRKTLLAKGISDEGSIDRVINSVMTEHKDRSAYITKENLVSREEVFAKLKKGKAA